jgi:hypothetical protein
MENLVGNSVSASTWETMTMKVLVTGADAYIGVLLAPMLLEQQHDVVGLDTGLYRNGWLYTVISRILSLQHKNHSKINGLKIFTSLCPARRDVP